MPHKAKLLFHRKYIFPEGSIVEMKAWSVPRSPRTPEGLKYSMAYIDEQGRRVLGYDNAEGKGHHRHAGTKETPIVFDTIETLIEKFSDEVAAIRRSRP